MEHTDDRYYVPHGSHWPVVGSLGLLFLMLGVSTWLNGADSGFYIMMTGVGIMIIMLLGWFGTVIGEDQKGVYNAQVDQSFRQGMMWFIFSEVMFFAAFFGALFYARNMSIPSSRTCSCGPVTKAPGRPTARPPWAASSRRWARWVCRWSTRRSC